MSAIYSLVSYLVGFDPREVRAEHARQTETDRRANEQANRMYRNRLREDPLPALIKHLKKDVGGNGSANGTGG